MRFSTVSIHVIEFQKRGLPYCHMLLWIDKRDATTIEEFMNLTICAEIPDKKTYPRLNEIVMAHMIYGPCGAINKNSSCMDGERCA